MLSPFTLTLSLVVPLILLTIFPLAVLSSLPLLFYLTITCMSSPPLFALTRSFCLVTLFVFSLCLLSHFFVTLSSSHCFVHFFPSTVPPPLLYSSSLSPSHPLVSFPSLVFTRSLSFLFPSHSFCLRFWAMFTKHIGTGWWSMSFAMITHMHTQTHAYVRAHTDLLGMVVDEQCQTQHPCPSELLKKPH